jgi:hypothetical protein
LHDVGEAEGRDPNFFWQDSTPSYERSCPPFRPHFETGITNSKNFKKMQDLRVVSSYVTKLPGKKINL